MPLDVYQQVFSLSAASNLVNGFEGNQADLQESLQSILNVALPLLGWKLVWGPVVFKNKPDNEKTGPDNSWFVAYHPKLNLDNGIVAPTYVIAVAGTPVASGYAWFQENFAVDAVADFKEWVKGGLDNPPEPVAGKDLVQDDAYIAIGTVKAVHLLLNTQSPEGAEAAGSNLCDFIAATSREFGDSRFIFTGHSLGAALAPSTALALVEAGVVPAKRTLTYPTAGPSPGNGGFTNLFVQTFPRGGSGEESEESYKVWNLNIVNLLDVVPQAWSVKKSESPDQNLGNIPWIFGKPAVPLVVGITVAFAVHVLSSGVLYKPLPSKYFRGVPPTTPPKDLLQFVAYLGPQHEQAYIDFIGITIPGAGKERLSAGLREKNEVKKRFNHPVIADYEWALEHPKETEDEVEKAKGSAEGAKLLVNFENPE